jgi:hypothetical protein
MTCRYGYIDLKPGHTFRFEAYGNGKTPLCYAEHSSYDVAETMLDEEIIAYQERVRTKHGTTVFAWRIDVRYGAPDALTKAGRKRGSYT